MAKKNVGRAAGLAALAGLAYMALSDKNKSKSKGADRDTDTGVDAMPSSAAKKADDIMVSGEGGFDAPADMSSVPRVGTPARIASSVKNPATAAPSTAMPDGAFRGVRSDMKNVGGGRSGGRGGPEAGEEAAYRAKTPALPAGAFRGTRSDMKDVGGGRSSGRGGPEAGEEAAYRAKTPAAPKGALRGMRSDMPSSGLGGVRRPGTNVNYENEETSDMSMKRGGKVKKMASGGMTSSASKRGDGIASKGKTRCKIC